jgi:hypothetical protein
MLHSDALPPPFPLPSGPAMSVVGLACCWVARWLACWVAVLLSHRPIFSPPAVACIRPAPGVHPTDHYFGLDALPPKSTARPCHWLGWTPPPLNRAARPLSPVGLKSPPLKRAARPLSLPGLDALPLKRAARSLSVVGLDALRHKRTAPPFSSAELDVPPLNWVARPL